MERGEKTAHPGLYRTPTGFVVRVKACGSVKTKELTKALRGATEEEALVWLRKLTRQAEIAAENEKASVSTTILTAYARSWVRELREQRDRGELKPRTVEAHVWNLERFILPLLGRLEVQSLTRKSVKDWIRDVQEMRTAAMRKGRGNKLYKQPQKPYSKATLKGAWRTCHMLMAWLTVEAGLALNPASELRGRMHSPPAKDRTWLTPDELVRLVDAAATENDARLLPLVLVSLEGALRPCESSGLDVIDFDALTGTVSIAKSHTNGHVGATKTVGSRRIVHLTPRTVEAVRRYLEGRTDGDAKSASILFPTTSGTRMTPASISDLLRRASVRAGIEARVTGYTLRRTTVDLTRRSSSDGGTIARLIAGHATIEMTEHYSKGQHDERVALVERALYAGRLAGQPDATRSPTAANPGEA